MRNSGKAHKKRDDKETKVCRQEINPIAITVDKWQNKCEVKTNDKNRDKKSPEKTSRVAGRSRRYKLPEEGIQKKDSGLGGKIYGIREGAGEYGPPKGTPQKGEDSTRPLDSTRYFDTAQGRKTYSEVAEILAVSVAKTIETIINGSPEVILVTPEWICKIHNEIGGSLFPDWAGRFRDVNVQVGTHIPPPYYEVPVHIRLYCQDLSARLSSVKGQKDIEKISETLAFADWRFQWIHPFKDFNGRVGRILLSATLFSLKLPPAETASVDPQGKEGYLNALHIADTGDLSLLTEVWVERLLNAFEENREK
ncbi:MAG: Fic family protein [Nitrospinae bacterium]|nr:Fic family protein [Nitrospinota bacterium]